MKWAVVRRKLAQVDRAIDKAIANAEIPGAVVMARVPWKDEVVEHLSVRGMAVLRPERIPMARATIFDLASLTKPIATTTAVLQLVHEGAIALDDPVSKVLPAFSERDKDGVTMRHLLTHSSGLKPWRGVPRAAAREGAQDRRAAASRRPRRGSSIIDRTLRSGLVHEPGEAAVYGDLDFIVLGAVVEAVAQQPLDEYCAERIFAPLRHVEHLLRAQHARRLAAFRAGAPEDRRDRELPVAQPHSLGRGPRPQRLGHGRGRRARRTLRARRRRDDVRADHAGRLPRPQRRPAARPARDLLHAPEASREFGLGARLGHADEGSVVFRPSISRRTPSDTSASRGRRCGSISNARPSS